MSPPFPFLPLEGEVDRAAVGRGGFFERVFFDDVTTTRAICISRSEPPTQPSPSHFSFRAYARGGRALEQCRLALMSDRLHLTARDLACIRGGRVVFENLNFTVASGQALVVTGPNGAGKSSLLRQIAGLVEITSGALALEGGEAEASISEQAHYIGHLDALKSAMSVRETADFWSGFLGGAQSDIDTAFEVFDLDALADLPVAYLSAGQRRRLALARLLIAPRPLWLLDEPSVALDAASLARLVAAMERHLGGGGIIVAATHQALGLSRTSSLDLSRAKVPA